MVFQVELRPTRGSSRQNWEQIRIFKDSLAILGPSPVEIGRKKGSIEDIGQSRGQVRLRLKEEREGVEQCGKNERGS